MLQKIVYRCSLFLILILTGSCAGLGTSSLTGSNDSTVTSVELSDTETSLYESGVPFSLPVTISKLDSIDVDKTTVEYGTNSTGSSQLIRAATTNETGYNVIGTAGAANTEQADFVMLANSSTSVIEPVNDDGSFEIFIASEEGETYAIVPLDETQQTGGIPVYVIYQSGVTTFMLTNSDVINSGQNLVNHNGSIYFSAVDNNGEYSIYAKPIDGTSLTTVATGIQNQVRYLAVDDSGNLGIATQDGAITYITNTGASNLVSNPVQQNLMYQTTIFDEIYNFGTEFDAQEMNIPVAVKLFFDSSGNLYIANSKEVNYENMSVVQENLLTKYNPNTDTLTGLIAVEDADKVLFAQGATDTLHMVLRETSSDPFSVQSLDLTLGETAWDQRQIHYTNPYPSELFLNISASVNGILSLTSSMVQSNDPGDTEDDIVSKRFYFQHDDLSITEVLDITSSDTDHSEFTYIAPESTFENASFITCIEDPDDNKTVKLMFHRIGIEQPNQMTRLTNTSVGLGCYGVYTIDLEGRILFYNESLGDNPQLSLIKIDELKSDELELIEFISP